MVFPRNIKEVQQLILLANKYNFKIVLSGGRTGLSGGAIANDREVVLSLDKMNKILEFNVLDSSLRVEAGITTLEVQDFALKNNLMYPVDFASKGSSQIGGNIATNAGGIQVIRYGLTRNSISGLKVVTGRGEILDLNKGLIKNASGYDLRHLIIGSEGTLACVVEATLQLVKKPSQTYVLLLSILDLEGLISFMNECRSQMPLIAFEFFSDNSLDYVVQSKQIQLPFEHRTPYYALMEWEHFNDDLLDDVFNIIENYKFKKIIQEDRLAQDSHTKKMFWSYREEISASISYESPYKNDISFRISNLSKALNEITRFINKMYPQFKVLWFGHIADGNIHINIIKNKEISLLKFKKYCEEVNMKIFEIVQKYKGSISAEHGVGLYKKPFLHYTKSQEEIAIMKGIKAVFDPNNVLNPNKIF